MMNFSFSLVILLSLSVCLAVTTYAIVLSRSLINSIIFMSSSSVLLMLCYLLMDAPDVSMTEAAIGCSLSTILLLRFVSDVKETMHSSCTLHNKILGLSIAGLLLFIMIYTLYDITPYGDVNHSFHSHISKYYIENTSKDVGVSSFVAAILASYRGYDTLGETTVILTAAAALSIILRRNHKNDDSTTYESKQFK